MPTAAATWAATAALSPVSRIGRSPSPRSREIAAAEPGLSGVPQADDAGRFAVHGDPDRGGARSLRRRQGPPAARRRERCRSPPASPVRPAVTSRPSTVPWTPPPGAERKPATAGRAPAPSCCACPAESAAAAMARAIGCSEAFSTAPARRRTSASLYVPKLWMPSTARRPVVTVPVLSSRIVSTVRVSSRTCGPLMRMPSWAPRPVPVSSPTGVASPRAQGQAMTSTATAAVKAARTSSGPAAGPAASSQAPKVRAATARTTGTKTALIRSASRAMGAFPVCAAETRRPIWARVVSEPTRVARTRSRPEVLIVAPVTWLSGPTSTGTDSPVTSEASTAEEPSRTTPSVAIFSPGRTTITSPTVSWPAGILFLAAVAQHGGVLRAEAEQGFEGIAGPPLGPGLQVAAQQQEGGDHGRDLEIEAAGVHAFHCRVLGQARVRQELPGGERVGGDHAD